MTAYRTTLPKRTRDVTREDFAGLKQLNINGWAERAIRTEELDRWNEIIPYTPGQVSGLLSEGYPDAPTLTFDLSRYGIMIIRILGTGGTISSMLEYELYPTFRRVNSGIDIPEGSRGQGLGSTWMRNALEFTHAMGGDEFTFTATNANGAYTWARANGYVNFNVRNFEVKRQEISRRCLGRLEIIRDYLSSSDYESLKALNRILAKDDLVRVAKMTHLHIPLDFKPDAMNVTRHPYYDDLVSFYRECDTDQGAVYKANTELLRINTVFTTAAVQGHKSVNVPRYLLSGGSWPGIYNFSDQKQMDEAGTYFGGWKTIQPDSRLPASELVAQYA